jgi:hypothetical protein
MNPYNVLMLPLEKLVLSRIRKEIISKAYGNVLENWVWHRSEFQVLSS